MGFIALFCALLLALSAGCERDKSSDLLFLSGTQDDVSEVEDPADDPELYPVADFVATPIVGASPAAAFSPGMTSGPAALNVQFQDDSEGNITQWLWDFGNGETSELQNPSHIYSVSGTYSVTLSVSGPYGKEP